MQTHELKRKAGIIKRLLLLSQAIGFLLCLVPGAADTSAEPPLAKRWRAVMTYTPLMLGSKVLGQPLVKVRLNKTTDATFLVDTGSATSIISGTLARQLGMHLEPAITGDGKPFNLFKKQTLMGRVSSLAIGDVAGAQLTFTDQPLIVDTENTLHLGPVTPYDGTIGANIIKEFALLLDPQAHTLMCIGPGDLSPARLRLFGMTSPYVLPIARDKPMTA